MFIAPEDITALGFSERDVLRHSSPLVQEIAKVIGYELTLRVWCYFSGRQIYIPRSPQAGQQLVELVGRDAAQKIIDSAVGFGGFGRVTVLPNIARLHRKLKCVQMLRDGASLTEVTIASGMSRSTITRFKADFYANPL